MMDEKRAYAKGYAAGRKKRRRQEVVDQIKNDRFTTLAAAIISAAMPGQWGSKVKGVHKPYGLEQLEVMAVSSARRMLDQMEVF